MNYNLALYFTAIPLLLATVVMGQSSTDETSSTTEASESEQSSTISSSLISTSSTPTLTSTTMAPATTTANYTSSIVFSPEPTVQGTGWNPNGNTAENAPESWLKTHNRFVFVIFVGLIVLGLLLWYIVRSVKGMRRKLKEENEAHLAMMQQPSSTTTAPRPDNHECATPISPPPAYKFDDHSQQGQHPN
ncbi:hypothetical protein G6F56_003974 [Rhizopus delemar]|uniref:Mid2 domain-containing protein n=1 Tax=Rhizopus stolonifer TaxID=4846 RepID=A0A367JVK4_RHIST|nr:hypothetical protein G6F56_003974 [Rhizopus delemar]RCH93966.1 hypothetical protein CU098_010754 [Rhizopus stolonifer]